MSQSHQRVEVLAGFEYPRRWRTVTRDNAQADRLFRRRCVVARKFQETPRPPANERIDARHEQPPRPQVLEATSNRRLSRTAGAVKNNECRRHGLSLAHAPDVVSHRVDTRASDVE